MLPGHQIAPIVSPDGIIRLALFLLRNLYGILAVGVHDPDVVAPVPVTRKRDFLPIGAETRLAFVGGAPGKELCRTAGYGHRVDIPEKIEDNLDRKSTRLNSSH